MGAGAGGRGRGSPAEPYPIMGGSSGFGFTPNGVSGVALGKARL